MNCPRCDAADGVEVRDAERTAKCRRCGLVFDPARARPRLRGRDGPPSSSQAAALVAPHGFEASETQIGRTTIYRDALARGRPELVITRRWVDTSASASNVQFFPLGFFIGGVVAFLPGKRGTFPELGVACFIAALLSVVALVMWRKNSTRIAVEGGRLRIAHGPFPWFGNRDIAPGRVEQLYCQLIPATRNEPDQYRVYALFHGSRSAVLLVGDLATPEQALFLEEALERALGIQDRPIIGELLKRTLSKVGRW